MTVIAVAMAGNVDGEAAAYAELCLATVPGVETRRLEPFPELTYAWDAVRRQYSSTLVLRDSVSRRPPDASKLLVLTEHDIFIPMLSFVYGQAQLSGPVAVLSLARLRQEFYGLPPNPALFLLRLRKEVLHEIGHTFGLTHCTDSLCTMSLSTNIQQLDLKQGVFCEDCALLLSESVEQAGSAANTPSSTEG